ncbi:serine/threonine-protein kinase [Kribbella amoyensis]|uniref:non-specific serine/threonine protein kinase n=1 Tax=Kribbella amoyensis TaxID=996641 RepID=A0A561BST2_9ACTN|nr:serine/threonine-protein kinase [Kribbella amoyensis]TWD81889.1 serine/threonine-protein kinase [Kribbella amoyensis]
MLVAERYRLSAPLGRGGMGEVHRATDEVLGREVAVKLLLPSRLDPVATARFQREARAAAMVADQNVVAAYDFGRHDDGWFLVMELVEGRTLAEEVRQSGPLPSERAIAIVQQAAAGLATAHRHDIVHRDIKPGNLLLTADGTVKLTDFGIARFLEDTTTTLTATGQVLGTSYYLAPERAQGRPAGKASDMYALGCVLYHLLTGHPPFQADQPASVMYQHVATPPVRPSVLRPELGGPIEDLLLSMLAKDPAARPTAHEVATAELPAAVEGLPGPDDEPTMEFRQPPSMRRRLIAVAAALTVVVGSSSAVLLDSRGTRVPETANFAPPTQPAPKPSTTIPKPTGISKPKPKPTPTQSARVVGTTQRRTEAKPSVRKPSNQGKSAQHPSTSNGKAKGKHKNR